MLITTILLYCFTNILTTLSLAGKGPGMGDGRSDGSVFGIVAQRRAIGG